MASNVPEHNTCPRGDARLTAVVFGTYFASDLTHYLHEEAVSDSDIVPEWEPEVKNAHALKIQKLIVSFSAHSLPKRYVGAQLQLVYGIY